MCPTGQADGSDSEALIHPRALFRDPFRRGWWLPLCDTYLPQMETPSNNTVLRL